MSLISSRRKKYFSFLDNSSLPPLVLQKDPFKATIHLLKKNKFIYLDLNTSNVFKPIELNDQAQSDQADQSFGPYVVCEASKSCRQNSKLKEFLVNNHKLRQKRLLLKSKIKQELDKSKDKFATYTPQKTKSNLKLYRGMSNQKYQFIKNTIDTQNINNRSLIKQHKLVQKFGIITDFQSITDKVTPSFIEKTKRTQKYFLPKVLKPYDYK